MGIIKLLFYSARASLFLQDQKSALFCLSISTIQNEKKQEQRISRAV